MLAPKSLVIDLTKCQWATLCYTSNTGYKRWLNPTRPTVHGALFEEEAPHFSDSKQTMLEYAIANKLLDVWHPVCTFQLSANHTVTYTGDKAISMYYAWKAKILSQSIKKKK